MRGEAEREREAEANTAQTESSLKPAACIVMHYALLLSKHTSNFRKQAFTFNAVLHYINKNVFG